MREEKRIDLAFGEEPVFELIAADKATLLGTQIRSVGDHRPTHLIRHCRIGWGIAC